jgi:dienelactone hydrolase
VAAWRYFLGGGRKGFPCYLALPDRNGPTAVVGLMHERYGLFCHTEDLARRLAFAGYAVLAPDLFCDHPDLEALYAGRVTFHPGDREVVGKIEDALTTSDGVSGVDVARRLTRFGAYGRRKPVGE